MSTTKLPGHQLRALAVEASVHPSTFAKAVRGEHVTPMPMSRIRATLERHGMADLLAGPRATNTTVAAG
ncbi:MAG TPA: hypothetical protein PKA88_37710 [Polyangiaceae bacterium]|nr:hypothetical protein [Polyangiaceae bacterium]HMR79413.1 hypothetical protein [Polyangiaceae bacterium]